jgi:DNA polymerase-3 subunit delta
MKYEEVIRDLKNKVYHPIYFLMGEESYHIDQISDYISTHVLNDMEKEFNQTIVYGRDTNMMDVISVAKRFPMMSNHQVVIVKEAQHLKKIEDLLPYVENPLSSTLLVFCYKYKKLDKRKAITKAIAKNSVLFTSDKMRDYQVPDWISGYLTKSNYKIGPKASHLIADYLGNDLSKVVNELDKLKLIVPAGSEITTDIIQRNIGISKDFNIFELQNALANKDIYKANLIAKYFADNQKQHPFVVTISSLYTYFSKIMKFHFLKDKSERNVAAELKVHPFFVKDYSAAAKRYPAKKIARIIEYLRDYDLMSKGVDNASVPEGELLKEMIFKIMH